MTTKQTGDERFYGEVVNINDPEKNGRVQVRVYGSQDDKQNIKDADLFWMHPFMDVTSASINKIGKSPTGMLVGSKIVGKWADPNDKQIGQILGTFHKAGDPKEGGATVDGQKELDTSKSSIPPQARPDEEKKEGGDFNPVVSKAKESDNDATKKNIIRHVANEGLKEPAKKTIGGMSGPDDILDKIKKMDPSNLVGAVQNAVDSIKQLKSIQDMASPEGLAGLAKGVLQQGLGQMLQKLGNPQQLIGHIQDILKVDVVSGLSKLANMSEVGQHVILDTFDSIISDIKSNSLAPLTQSNTITANTTIDTGVNPQDLVDHVTLDTVDEVMSQIMDMFKAHTIDEMQLDALIQQIMAILQKKGQNKVLGNNNGSMANMAGLLGSIGGSVMSIMSDHLQKSVLDPQKIQKALEGFTKNQAILTKKRDIAKKTFTGKSNKADEVANNAASVSVDQTLGPNPLDKPPTYDALGNYSFAPQGGVALPGGNKTPIS